MFQKLFFWKNTRDRIGLRDTNVKRASRLERNLIGLDVNTPSDVPVELSVVMSAIVDGVRSTGRGRFMSVLSGSSHVHVVKISSRVNGNVGDITIRIDATGKRYNSISPVGKKNVDLMPYAHAYVFMQYALFCISQVLGDFIEGDVKSAKAFDISKTLTDAYGALVDTYNNSNNKKVANNAAKAAAYAKQVVVRLKGMKVTAVGVTSTGNVAATVSYTDVTGVNLDFMSVPARLWPVVAMCFVYNVIAHRLSEDDKKARDRELMHRTRFLLRLVPSVETLKPAMNAAPPM